MHNDVCRYLFVLSVGMIFEKKNVILKKWWKNIVLIGWWITLNFIVSFPPILSGSMHTCKCGFVTFENYCLRLFRPFNVLPRQAKMMLIKTLSGDFKAQPSVDRDSSFWFPDGSLSLFRAIETGQNRFWFWHTLEIAKYFFFNMYIRPIYTITSVFGTLKSTWADISLPPLNTQTNRIPSSITPAICLLFRKENKTKQIH